MNIFSGENFIKLQGKITKVSYKEYQNGNRFSCSLAVPTDEMSFQYISVSVWGDMADQLGVLKTGTWIRVHGHMEKRSYNAQCRFCGADHKVFWTDVAIDNFVVLDEI
jgi:single-stranded DNA-binding protein